MAKVTINVPSFASSKAFLVGVVKEVVLTAFVAGAGAGLTALAQDIPSISAHYGLNPLVTAQLIAVVGTARALVSNIGKGNSGGGTSNPTA